MLLSKTSKINKAANTIDSINVQSGCISDTQNSTLFIPNNDWQNIVTNTIINSVTNILNSLKNRIPIFLYAVPRIVQVQI